MFVEDKTRKYIDVKKEQILTLLTSTIRAHVALPGKPTEPADAYICTFRLPGNLYETLVFFHLTSSQEGVVYRWEDGPQPKEPAKNVEKEAKKFLEAMGFQIDSLYFRKKSPEEQQRLYETMPCFKADLSYLREPSETESELETLVVDEEEGLAEEAMEEISVESVEDEVESVAEEAVVVEATPVVAEGESGATEEESVAVEAVEEEESAEVAEAIQEDVTATLEVGEETFEEAFGAAVEPEEESASVGMEGVEVSAEESVQSFEVEGEAEEKVAVEVSDEGAVASEMSGAEDVGETEAVAVAGQEEEYLTETEEVAEQVIEAVPAEEVNMSAQMPTTPSKEISTDESLEPLARFLASM